MITRDQLFGSFVRRYRTVNTPIGPARIQNLNEDELAEFQHGQLTKDGKLCPTYAKQRRRRLVAMCLVDEKGERLLNQPGDITRLGPAADSAVITVLFLACLEHCGLQQLEGDAEELEKNSAPTTGDDSPTT